MDKDRLLSHRKRETCPFLPSLLYNIVLGGLASVSVLAKAVKATKIEKEHGILSVLLCIHRGNKSQLEKFKMTIKGY